MSKKIKKAYKNCKNLAKKHASKGVSIAGILAVLSGFIDLYNETRGEKTTSTQIWSHIAEKEKEIQVLDKRVSILEYQNSNNFTGK